MSQKLSNLLHGHVYVGVVDENTSLVQYKTQLHVVSHKILIREFFYQQVLLNIGSLYSIELGTPIPVVDLIRASGCDEKDVVPWSNVLTMDSTRRAMLLDYFSIEINEDGCLVSLPDLLPGYFPMRVALPVLIVELSTHVDWKEEEQCFVGAARALGLAFGMLPRSAARTAKIEKKKEKEKKERDVARDGGVDDGGGRGGDRSGEAGSPEQGLQRDGGSESAAISSGTATTSTTSTTSTTTTTTTTSVSTPTDAVDDDHFRRLRDVLQHSLFPAFKQGAPFFPPTDFLEDRAVVQVAALENLYKVFERC